MQRLSPERRVGLLAGEGGTFGRGIPRSMYWTGWRPRPNLRWTGRSKEPMSVASFASYDVMSWVKIVQLSPPERQIVRGRG